MIGGGHVKLRSQPIHIHAHAPGKQKPLAAAVIIAKKLTNNGMCEAIDSSLTSGTM